jgi:hypothetical protein
MVLSLTTNAIFSTIRPFQDYHQSSHLPVEIQMIAGQTQQSLDTASLHGTGVLK